MRGDRVHRGVWIGLAISALMHTGVGFLAATIPMSRGDGARGGSLGGVLALNVPDQGMTLPPADDEDLRRLEEMLRSEPLPPVPPALAQPTPPRLVLGIENSNQATENWLGSADPTEHHAKLSDVMQPQLDPNPGDPGTRAGDAAMGPVGPVAPELIPASAEANAQEKRLKSPEVKARDGEPDGADQATPGAKVDERGIAEKSTKAQRGGLDPSKSDAPLPGTTEQEKGRIDGDRGEDAAAEKAAAARAFKAIKPKTGADGDSEANEKGSAKRPGRPDERPMATPAAPSAASGDSSSNPGGGGEHAGEKSEKEADASSTDKSIEIRPGHPAAAQGLDITTKRPNFTRLTRVTAYPANPLLKVTFNAQGIVTKVVLMESSGVSDVDGPVINAIYQWTAKGRVLAELTAADPAAGITISVRILLR